MRFTVQLMSHGNQSTSLEATWAVLLNHEHIMYVGTYRQCEEWLDLYGVEQIEPTKRSPREKSSGGSSVGRSRIAGWFNGLAQRRIVRDVCQRTVAFLADSSGHIGLVESVGLAISMVAVYVMLTTCAMAWNRAIMYDGLVRVSRSPHTSLVIPVDRSISSCDPQSLDIACDLAQFGQ